MRITKASSHHSELRATVALAVPVVFVQLGFMAMGAVDTLMVGRLSATMLAAVALGNLYFFNVSIFGAGALMALDPLVAQAIGARDMDAVTHAMQRGIVLAVALAVATSVVLAPAAPLLRLLHQPAEIVPGAAGYLRISIIGTLPFLTFVVLRQSLQAMHRVAPIVITILVANLSNAALNWVFVYGHLGSPALGVAGSAIATAISRWVMLLLLLALAWRDLAPHLMHWRRDSTEWAALRNMLAIGAPIGAQQALEAGAFGAIGLLMGVLGTIEMAAHQIAITLAALTFMVPLGVATAAAVRVGYAIGAGDDGRAQGGDSRRVRVRRRIHDDHRRGISHGAATSRERLHQRREGDRACGGADSDRRRVSGVRRRASGRRRRVARCRRHHGAAARDARVVLARWRSGECVPRIRDRVASTRAVVGLRRVARGGRAISLFENQTSIRARGAAIGTG